MKIRTNLYQQPVGTPLPDWRACAKPSRHIIQGCYCHLKPLNADLHADDLYAAYALSPDDRDWTYLPIGPFHGASDYRNHAKGIESDVDCLHFAVVDQRSGRAVGTLALIRMDPANGVIEIGFVVFSPLLRRTPGSTEAHYLLMKYLFDGLGYRRLEWKCDSLNEPSRLAAQRLGFRFEGIFRQAVVYKGRNRDTAWFSILDCEWPSLRAAFERWLAPDNFDAHGVQRSSLAQVRATI
ncbi:MAG: GNAT family N-acetyltransferase [Magnetococcales bacterium]|nr:GNAT family N-acetyltransferase [Magnetococcales bacterium]